MKVNSQALHISTFKPTAAKMKAPNVSGSNYKQLQLMI